MIEEAEEPNLQGKLEFYGDSMIVGEEVVAYGKQMLTNDMLYITDMAMEVRMTMQIDQFDQQFFLTLLNKHIVKELEVSHPKVGLQILQQMPTLDAKSFSFFFLKLSLPKLQRLLMYDHFYLYLFKVCVKLVNGKEPTKKQIADIQTWMCDDCMSKPYQRLLNLLDSLRKNEQKLRPAIEQTTHQIVLNIIRQRMFIFNLAYDYKVFLGRGFEQVKMRPSFLRELLSIMTTLQSLAKTSNEITDFYQLSHKDLMSEFIFTKECLNTISQHFEHFFLYERKALMRILSLIATHDNVELWTQLINFQNKVPVVETQKEKQEMKKKKEKEQQERREKAGRQVGDEIDEDTETAIKRKIVKVQRYFNNVSCFSQMIMSHFYGGNQENWDLSLHILQQLISTNLPQVHEAAAKVIIDVLEHKWDAEQIELALQLIQSMAAITPNYSPTLPALLAAVVSRINVTVYEIFKTYSRLADKVPETKLQNTVARTTCHLLRFPKINSSQLCAFLRVFIQILSLGLIDLLQPGQFCLIVEKLLFMSKGREGIILSLRRIIQKKVGIYVESRAQVESQQKKSNDSCLLRNRKELKNFKISTPKVDPNSIDRFKGLLLM